MREIEYFELNRDTIGLLGFSIIKKFTVALGMLAYGIPRDTYDDYLCIVESTIPCIGSAGQLCQCLEITTCAHPMQKTQLEAWQKTHIECFLGCLEASIVCTGHGKLSICTPRHVQRTQRIMKSGA
jgi:hypothetical protein